MMGLKRNKDAERLQKKNVKLATKEIGVMTVNEFHGQAGACLVGGLDCEILKIEQTVDILTACTLTVKANFHIECGEEYQVTWLGKVYEAKCIETEMEYKGKVMQLEAKFRVSGDLISGLNDKTYQCGAVYAHEKGWSKEEMKTHERDEPLQDQCIWNADEAKEAERRWLDSIRWKLKRKGYVNESTISNDS